MSSPPLHVGLICIELFGDSIYGGFGRSTRFIGRELVKRGVRVSILVPRRSPERPDTYELEGMTVHQFSARQPWRARRLFRAVRADIFHSQDASTGTLLARLAAPRSVHLITFRDPMDRADWKIERGKMPRLGWSQYRFFISNPLVTFAVRRADALFCAAEFLAPKAAGIFGLKQPPVFLPSPVNIPASVRKAERPTVCYMGRMEGRKRVELFLDLAQQCPEIDFIAAGAARDPARDRWLRETYGHIPNLRLTGVLDQFTNPEWSEVLGKSWILVNTSAREGLPTTFVEAAAHRCAILSFTDPDRFASRFGVVAREGALRQGLMDLLVGNRWKTLGDAGWQHVSGIFSVENAMEAHLQAYAADYRRKHSRGGPS